MALPLDQETGRAFEVLHEEECMTLLNRGWFGRVAVTFGAIPAVFPVNYYAEGGAIYFLTGTGAKLSSARRREVVTFEVDDVDIRYHHGWSVLAVGAASVVDEQPVRDMVIGNHLQPWAPGDRQHLVRIWPDMVTGRRITFGPPAPAAARASEPALVAQSVPLWLQLSPMWAAATRPRKEGHR
jgi:nitroimidazol reductase NimA-like FMN-containing flavoprotein (pyridoxamine 5'-phosphate oxidase superfamily)